MSILPDSFQRYIRFFVFINKYWNADFITIVDENRTKESENLDDFNHTADELVEDLKKMGPTYIKLGQLLSTRPDLLPSEYILALQELQNDLEPFSYDQVQEIFYQEIGQRISSAFKHFQVEPIATASIGQVHKAVLHSGETVAVKIQRPGIRKRMFDDLDVLLTLSEKAEKYSDSARKFAAYAIIKELNYILLQELDYQKEAQNLIHLKANLQEFSLLSVPLPILAYCSSKVLTMEFVEGMKITDLTRQTLNKLAVRDLADQFIKGYLKQIILDGFVHADPHPGNIHITNQGKLALMDLGMVAKFSNTLQENMLKLMIALGDYDGEQVGHILLEMSEYDDEKADIAYFSKITIRKVQESENKRAGDLQTGRIILELNKVASNSGIQLPVELSILAKILLNMDQIIAFLCPDYNFQVILKEYSQQLFYQKVAKEITSSKVLHIFLQSKTLVETLPERLNKFTENLADNKLKIKVDAIDQTRFAIAFQKVANRITIGLIIAALILGAALMMRIPTAWTLGGYPGLAILLFLFAVSIGIYLVYLILFKDESNSHEK